MSNIWERLLQPDILFFLIPVMAILVWGAIAITRMIILHRERLALIEHGFHPDQPPPKAGSPQGAPPPPP